MAGVVFRPEEIAILPMLPQVLVALADYHSAQATMADAIGDFGGCVAFHEARSKELRDAAVVLCREYEEG
jgi:hypothetical protein